jgi:hypothetical protein
MPTDLRLTLEDAPGQGARLGEALGRAGVNIEGICAVTAGGRATVHVLVEDAAAARSALEGAGLSVDDETEPLVTDVGAQASTPGAMGSIARRLADAGVNISFVYLATNNRAVLGTSDMAKARQALGA